VASFAEQLAAPALQQVRAGEHFQLERHGYFIADAVDPVAGAPLFNRAVTLRGSWAKAARSG
jgi:glutaminyl-tRNA synthetase